MHTEDPRRSLQLVTGDNYIILEMIEHSCKLMCIIIAVKLAFLMSILNALFYVPLEDNFKERDHQVMSLLSLLLHKI